MYVEIEVGAKKLQVIANAMDKAKEPVDAIGLLYWNEKGYTKGVNTKSLLTYGVALGANIWIGP